ncbi:cytochrome P450 [Streptomyces albireticuli]|uniref:cytochrome P450 n=1 Tax=Streptomyces albireticuli TaxID=1940 RepID=UPI0036C25636
MSEHGPPAGRLHPSPPAAGCPLTLPTRRERPLDPPGSLTRLNGTAPLHRLRYPDGHVGWLITRHSLVRSVLADPRFSARSELKRVPAPRPGADPFIGEPALPGWLVDMDRPEHTRIRRPLSGRFTMRAVDRLRPRVQEIVDDHLRAMRETGPPADLVASFALPVPSLTICELLGVPYGSRAEFQRASAVLFSLEVTAAQAAEAMAELDALLLDLVRHRHRHPNDDLLGKLVADGGLGDQEIAGLGVLLLTAGHETTAGMLGLGTLALLTHPGQLAALRADPGLLPGAVEELLRYLTIFHFGVPRTPLEDVELEGRLIRAGESVTLSLPAANRDPEAFDDPDVLDVTRRARGHVAFGYGMHQCVGQNLARAELEIGLGALVSGFPGLELAVPVEDVPLAADSGFYGVHALPVSW